MILRVYAMWNRSKSILSILLFIYASQTIITFVWDGIYTNPDDISGTSQTKVEVLMESNVPISSPPPVTIVKVYNFKHCTHYYITPTLATYREIPRFVLGTTLLILTVIPTIRESVEMYKSTKHWEINRTMKLLVRDGVLYFVAYVSLFPIWLFLCPSSAFALPSFSQKEN